MRTVTLMTATSPQKCPESQYLPPHFRSFTSSKIHININTITLSCPHCHPYSLGGSGEAPSNLPVTSYHARYSCNDRGRDRVECRLGLRFSYSWLGTRIVSMGFLIGCVGRMCSKSVFVVCIDGLC